MNLVHRRLLQFDSSRAATLGLLSASRPSVRKQKTCGVSLIELMVVISILGLLAAIAIPSYQASVAKSRNAQATADIAIISTAIERYHSNHFRLPPDFAAIGSDITIDPWGNPYRYLNIQNGGPGVTGMARKDKNLVPINSDYDLYSMGQDGRTATPLPAAHAQDDIIRAMNGAFIGLARDY